MTHRWSAANFGLVAAAAAAVALAVRGLAWPKIVLAAIAIGCLGACIYAWFLARRALASLEPAPATRGQLMDWAAPFYDAGCVLVGLGRRFRAWTLQAAALRAGEHVLDVGCGTGVLTRLAAQAVGASGEVIGIDPGPVMIAAARRQASASRAEAVGTPDPMEGRTTAPSGDTRSARGPRLVPMAEFRLAAIERLPFEDRRFEAVLSSLMLHHLPPDLKTQGLAEVYRVLKPGGRLVAVDLDRPANPLWWLLFGPWLLAPMTADNLRGRIPDYLRAAGFAPVEMRGRWLGVLTLWVARKPGNERGRTQE